jgi:hypothetical protein
MNKDTITCPKCGEVIVFINNEETKLCPICKELIININNNTKTIL